MSKSNGNAKLTEDIVRQIRKNHARGISAREMAQFHQLSLETVRRVIRGDTWSWVKDEPELGSTVLPPMTAAEEIAALRSQRKSLEMMPVKEDWMIEMIKEIDEKLPKNPMEEMLEEEKKEEESEMMKRARILGARV